MAAKAGATKVMEALLQRGARVDAVALELRATPLHLATQNGHLQVREGLLGKKGYSMGPQGQGERSRWCRR